jgi:hypothetical protein
VAAGVVAAVALGVGAAPASAVATGTTSPMAVASLVLGVLWLGGLGSVLAMVFGILGQNQVDRSGGMVTGRSMATWGLVLGIVGTVGSIAWIVVAAFVAHADGQAIRLGLLAVRSAP